MNAPQFLLVLADCKVRHLRLANQVIVLGKDGEVLQQGNPQGRRGFSSQLLAAEDPGPEKPEEINEAQEAQSSGSAASPREAVEALQQNRMYRDLSVYWYYFQSMGWLLLSIVLLLVTTTVFCSRFQRKAVYPRRV